MLNVNKKRVIGVLVAMVLTVVLSFSALSYSWFVRQVKLEKSHVFPATGFEILQFESDVTQRAQEGTLYPATLKENYLHNGFGRDFYNYDVIKRNGVLPDYIAMEAGKVKFKVDLSYWSGDESLNMMHKVITMNHSIKIKDAQIKGKSQRDFSDTGEVLADFEFHEHDKNIYLSDSEPVLRKGQFLKDNTLLFSDNLNRHDHIVVPNNGKALTNENHDRLVFGEYNNNLYNKFGNRYRITLSQDYYNHEGTGGNNPSGINIMKYSTNHIYYKDDANNNYLETLDCWQHPNLSPNGYTVDAIKATKNHQNIEYGLNNVNIGKNIFIPSISGLKVVRNSNNETIKILKLSEQNPPNYNTIYPGLPSHYNSYMGSVSGTTNGFYIYENVILTQTTTLYQTNQTIEGEDTILLEYRYFSPNNIDLSDDTLIYCYSLPTHSSYSSGDLPDKYMIPNNRFYVKEENVGYFRNTEVLHSTFETYQPEPGDEILFVHNQTEDIGDGDLGLDENGNPVSDPNRVSAYNIIIDDSDIVYKDPTVTTRYIEPEATYSAKPNDIILFRYGIFNVLPTDIIGLQSVKGKYILNKAYLLSNNTAVIRNNIVRIFTVYNPESADILLYQSGQIVTTPVGVENPVKSDVNGHYIENVVLQTNDYAYKDINITTGKYTNHVITASPSDYKPPFDPLKKPIVFKGKLVMGRDSTFLLNISIYLATLDYDTDPSIIGETFVFSLNATFEIEEGT